MSKFKAALITMFLGTSSAAMASPSVSFSANAQLSWGTSAAAPIVRDHRSNDYANAMPSTRMTWISLADSLQLSRGRDVLRPLAGNFTQIRLQAVTGNTWIGSVVIRFKDGTSQTVTFNEYLSRRSSFLQFDLQGRHRAGIDAIIINGQAMRRGSYQVFAMGSTVELPMPPVHQPPQPPVYQPPVYQPPVYQPPVVQQAPVMLSSELSFANTQGYRLVYVAGNAGTFSTLRVQSHAGAMPLAKVQITFVNGQTQTFSNIDRTLMPGEKVDLRLDPRGEGHIATMYVFTNDTMTQLSSVITGSFDVTGL